MTAMVAVDLGAQSGRVALGRFDGERLELAELHRFTNVPVRTARHAPLGRAPALRGRARRAARGGAARPGAASTPSASTRGASTSGCSIAPGGCSRTRSTTATSGTSAASRRVLARVPARELYERTGHPAHADQHRLPARRAGRGRRRARSSGAETLLLLPDLLHYWLSGERACEHTNATTTAVPRPAHGRRGRSTCSTGSAIPGRLLPRASSRPARALGPLRDDVADDTRLRGTTRDRAGDARHRLRGRRRAVPPARRGVHQRGHVVARRARAAPSR